MNTGCKSFGHRPVGRPHALAPAADRPADGGLPAGRRAFAYPRACAGFTMVEIALSLAIIGFALVAIVGVLPTGMQVQRENREETIIGQDAQVWLSAIRAGARGYDELTNYVDAITNIVTVFAPNGSVLAGPDRLGYTFTNCTFNNTLLSPANVITNGARIIGLLSTPKFTYHDVAGQLVARSNYVTAYVRAMSGAATEVAPQTNQNVRQLAFAYRMVSEVVPFTGWDTNWVAFNASGLTPEEAVARSNYWWVARNAYANLHEVRLLFRWPLLPNGQTGNGRQVFRATVGGVLANDPRGSPAFYYFNPDSYARYP